MDGVISRKMFVVKLGIVMVGNVIKIAILSERILTVPKEMVSLLMRKIA